MHLKKPNNILVDQGGEFYNKIFKTFLTINNIKMFSTYNEGKSAVAEKFIRTLKIFYFDVIDDTVNKYNNIVHITIKMKPIDVISNSYAEHNEDSNKKILNSKLVIMLEFQNTKTFFLRDTLKIGQKKLLLLVKLKIQFHGLMLLVT